MSYLVTGGSGFLGSRIVRQLTDKGREIVNFDSAGITDTAREVIGENRLKKVDFVKGDITDLVQLSSVIREFKCEYIIHTAALLGRRSDQEPGRSIQVNCIGMNNILEVAKEFSLKRVVWTGAVMAIGNVAGVSKEPIGDKAIYRPVSMYSATKALNEYMARLYFDRYGVDSIGIRVPQVMGVTFGPDKDKGSAGTFADFVRKAALKIPVTIIRPDGMSFIYVKDAAAAHVRACHVPVTKYRMVNVLAGKYYNRDLLEILKKLIPDADIKIENDVSGFFREPELDVSKMMPELGWEPEYDLEAILKEMIDHYRKIERMI